LGKALRTFGARVVFLTNDDPVVCRYVSAAGFQVEPVNLGRPWTSEDVERLLETAARHDATIAIVDSDEDGADYLGGIRKAGIFTVAIDDVASHPFPCHLVVNGDAHATQLRYESTSGDTVFLLGPRYAILREEFWTLTPPALRAEVQEVLVTVGGADPLGLTPRIISTLDQVPGEFTVSVIVGPFFENEAEIEGSARTSQRRVGLVRSPQSVASRFLWSDLAISAAGQTLYELACAGCPTVALAAASNQVQQLQMLGEAGVVVSLGPAESDDLMSRLSSACAALIEDPAARARMRRAGRGLIDGVGALRVARGILSAAYGGRCDAERTSCVVGAPLMNSEEESR
jgi:spore coat polysaccharide biosynthesis predicted glycosyltransferase SpsG